MVTYLKHIGSLLCIHIVALLLTSCLRVLTLCAIPYALPADVTTCDVLKALCIGVWFDNVVACYIMVLPVLVTTILVLVNRESPVVRRLTTGYLTLLFALTFILSIANIPYFAYFFENVNASIYQWFAYLPTTLGMLLTETSYWGYTLLMAVFVAGWWWFVRRLNRPRPLPRTLRPKERLSVLAAGVMLVGACVFGIRGRVGYNPIKVSQAYFCQDPFLNQLGISPTFNMLVTTLDLTRKENAALQLMDSDEACAEVRRILGLDGDSNSHGNFGDDNTALLSRNVGGHPSPHASKNVVIILMESMSADLLSKGDTPFLDSLICQSTYYSHAYSSGNHTNHGIYSTLYSYPAVMFRNMLKGSIIPHLDGMPQQFQQRGYRTAFFMSHESQYDNMNAFLRTNGFDLIRSQEDYPRSAVVNSFGVPDDFLLRYALDDLTALARQRVPFFSVVLTISNHPPYIVPDTYADAAIPKERQIVRYADGSLRQFFDRARREPWYANTLFVLLGDHGKLLQTKECELPESFNHIPLIIHGAGIPCGEQTAFALQMDVAPTLLGLMGWTYTQHDFGIDLNRRHRDYAFYTGDKYLAIRSRDYLYLYRPDDQAEYCYALKDGQHLAKASAKEPEIQRMKRHLFAMIQCAETLRQK